MMSTRKANSVFQKKPIYTLLAFGVAMAGFPNALAQSTYRESQDARTVTCSSDDGQRTYCDADTRGGVRLTRQLSGSACQQGSTWGSDSRGIWVDKGCRAEFGISSVSPARNYLQANTSSIACSSNDGRRVYCPIDTRGNVRLLRETGGSPCRQGSTWGYDSRGVWVDRGCKGEFEVSGGDGRSASNSRATTIAAGASVAVRTSQAIDVKKSDGSVFRGVVDQDVTDDQGRVSIPRGSMTELIVRSAPNRDLVLDLESVTVDGQRYAVDASAENVEKQQRDGLGKNARTGEFVGGGALLGTIIGAIAGGGKGAAIGAAAGAGAGVGAQVLTRGKNVKIPAESLLTFRLDQPLNIGVADNGSTRRGRHYHSQSR